MKKMTIKQLFQLSAIKVFLISLAHAVNDMYAAFLPAFMPFIKQNLSLSYALAGNFNVIVGFFHIICQPFIGYMCDRIRRPVLMAVGPILCGLGAVMIPNATAYVVALFWAGLWGLGSALYHPQGSGGIGYVSEPKHLTRSLTWFNIAGTTGTMLSPLIAVLAVRTWGYQGLIVTLVPALLLAPVLFFSMPVLHEVENSGERKGNGFFSTISRLFSILYPIWAVSLIRDLVFQCVRFFLPMKMAAEGASLESVGTILFLITLGGTLAMIPMEHLSRRWGGRKSLLVSMGLTTATLTLAAYLDGPFAIFLYLVGVSAFYATLPLTVSMAQTLVPGERSAASSIVMGLAWGFSNILLAPFGKAADWIGVENILVVVGLLPLLALPFLRSSVFQEKKEFELEKAF